MCRLCRFWEKLNNDIVRDYDVIRIELLHLLNTDSVRDINIRLHGFVVCVTGPLHHDIDRCPMS